MRIAPVTFRRPPLQAESSHTTMVLFSCHSPRTSQRPPSRDGSTSAVLRRVRLCTADGVEFVATPHSTSTSGAAPRIRPCRHTPPLPPSSSVVKRSASIDPSMCGGTYTLGMLLAPPPHTLHNDHPLSPTVPYSITRHYMPQTHTHTPATLVGLLPVTLGRDPATFTAEDAGGAHRTPPGPQQCFIVHHGGHRRR